MPTEGYEGGLIFDEVAIQGDLQLKRCGTEFELIGFVDSCEESELIDKLMGCHSLKLATHVLQLMFWGHTGFRFPIAHFPTVQASASDFICISGK